MTVLLRRKLWQDEGWAKRLGAKNMPRKKKMKRFRAVQAVKELARERIGAPPTEKVVPQKKRKAEKHKATLEKLLGEAE